MACLTLVSLWPHPSLGCLEMHSSWGFHGSCRGIHYVALLRLRERFLLSAFVTGVPAGLLLTGYANYDIFLTLQGSPSKARLYSKIAGPHI